MRALYTTACIRERESEQHLSSQTADVSVRVFFGPGAQFRAEQVESELLGRVLIEK